MWQTNSNFVRPNQTVEGAHTKGTETGSVVFGVDGRTVLTRGGDNTVKRAFIFVAQVWLPYINVVWDLRAFKKPLAVQEDLETLYPNTNATFSPDGKYVITGAASSVKGGKGKIVFLKKDSLDVVKSIETDATPVKVFWHPRINQVSAAFSWNCMC